MIVLDASTVTELLVGGPLADKIRQDLTEHDEALAVPSLLDIEVISALRGLAQVQRIDSHRAGELLAALANLPAKRYEHTPLLGRVWELRHNFTAYDAVYIALAEATDSVIYTTDRKLVKGHRAQTRLLAEPLQ